MTTSAIVFHDLSYSDLRKYMIHKTTNSISLKGCSEQLTHVETLYTLIVLGAFFPG